jgi:hypothetical protein
MWTCRGIWFVSFYKPRTPSTTDFFKSYSTSLQRVILLQRKMKWYGSIYLLGFKEKWRERNSYREKIKVKEKKKEKKKRRTEKSWFEKRSIHIMIDIKICKASRDCQRLRTLRYLSFWGHVAPESNNREREREVSLLVIFFNLLKLQAFLSFWLEEFHPSVSHSLSHCFAFFLFLCVFLGAFHLRIWFYRAGFTLSVIILL